MLPFLFLFSMVLPPLNAYPQTGAEPNTLTTHSQLDEETPPAQTDSVAEDQSPSSDNTLVFSLHEAVETALANRYELRVAQENVHMSAAALRAAKSEFYPTVDLIGSNNYSRDIDKFEPLVIKVDFLGTEYDIYPQSDVPDYRSDVSVALNQKLFSGGRIIQQIEGARERTEKSKITRTVEKRNIILSVTEACWELKKVQKISEIAGEAVRQAEIVFGVAKARCERGAISRLERDKAESELLQARLDMTQAESRRKTAIDDLFRQMGIVGQKDSSIVIIDEPERMPGPIEGDAKQLVERALLIRPELQEIERDIRAKESEVKASESGYYPQVDLRGEYHWVGYDNERLDQAWEDLHQDYWSVFLTAKYNLFQGFYTKNKVSQAKSGLSAARVKLNGQRTSIVHEVRQAYATVKSKSQEVANSERNVRLAEKNLEAVLKEFELGVATVDKVADYNISLVTARKTHIMSLIDFQIAKARLKWAVGDELP